MRCDRGKVARDDHHSNQLKAHSRLGRLNAARAAVLSNRGALCGLVLATSQQSLMTPGRASIRSGRGVQIARSGRRFVRMGRRSQYGVLAPNTEMEISH